MEHKTYTTTSGIKCWYKSDINSLYFHREDGPAKIWPNGHGEWYYENIQYITTERMPLQLFLGYCKWEYKRKL